VLAPEEDELLREVALRNAATILKVRHRAEDELLQARDALERRTEELALSLAMMKATLDSATDGILVTDARMRVTGHNEKFVQMWQVPHSLMQEQDHGRLLGLVAASFPRPDEFEARTREIYREAPATTFDLLMPTDGRVIERQSRPQVVDGRVVGRVWSYRDITEQRRAEEAAQRSAEERKRLLEGERSARNLAERMSALKDDFLATLSHELRTPLSAILGWVHILRRGVKNPEDMQKGLDTIERNSRLQIELIDDLLDMNRIASGKVRLDIQPLAPVTFIEAALETVRPAADAKGVRVERVLDPSAGPIHGDPNRLQQVMSNLLSNAVKFTPRGGKVQVLLARVNSHIEITVSDTGIGIKPDFVTHVFERFRQADASTTRQYGGLGLGLAIVKSLVELHGGSVHASSRGEGEGASFCVQLPVALAQSYAPTDSRVHPRGPVDVAMAFTALDLSGLKILVVDDDADGRELARRVLSECAAEVLVAGSAAEALALVQAHQPDVLVSDIGMPEVDGFELLRRVRALGAERGGRLPAIALTAFARSQDRTQALRAGFIAHLTKPVEPPELLATVASVAGRAG
jgi:signal transduction histidine kinase/CheY-like chemotaxis protein